MRKQNMLILLAAMAMPLGAGAVIELPDIVGDNMVVQQNSDARLWGWATPGSTITVGGSWAPGKTVSARTADNGRWDVALTTPGASFTPYTIKIEGDGSNIDVKNVLVGEVWFCSGQSNMEMPLRGFWTQPIEGAAQTIAYSGKYPGIRVATVPKLASYTPQDRCPSPWKESKPENAADFSALAYYFAQSLTELLNVPVGIISCAYGGSKVEGWQSREQLAQYPEWNVDKEAADSKIKEWERINVMYNAMLHPLIGYTIKGFLWNQGESNVGRHDTYPQHQRDMVTEWRSKWGLGELPFFFVELPGWEYGGPDKTEAARFRECQHEAARITPNSGIVCTSDLVYPYEVKDIHARKKKEIGERLAFMAAARTYGMQGVPATYPTFREMKVDGDKAVLSFDNAEAGFSPNQILEGFEAAGADKVFHPATAREIYKDRTIEVSCPEAGKIEAVRYNYKNFAIGKVFDLMGMPLVPFRTDNW